MDLFRLYEAKKHEIRDRIEHFKKVWNQPDERIFAELCFCICTPQSRAKICDKVISTLEKNGLLFTGEIKDLLPFMKGIRFYQNKAGYIIDARKFFMTRGKVKIKDKISSFRNSYDLREWLSKNIRGIGMKEASHFIRNIGFDPNNELAILDRHILKNLLKLGVIDKLPKTLTKKQYLRIERKMKEFARENNMKLYELDMLLWSKETGEVLK